MGARALAGSPRDRTKCLRLVVLGGNTHPHKSAPDLRSRTPADELAVLNVEELTAVRCKRHGLSLNTLMVETPSGKRFEFRTKKVACKQIEARSRMRSLTKR